MSIDVEQLYESGEINNFFYDQLRRNIGLLENDEQRKTYISEAKMMTGAGVASEEDRKNFYYISSYVDEILDDIIDVHVGLQKRIEIMADIFENRHKHGIDNLIKLYDAVAIAAQKMGLPVEKDILNRVRMRYDSTAKFAYPQGFFGSPTQPVYNIARWMQATRDIYLKANAGEDFLQAFNIVTERWSKMEKQDFKHWLRFYQEGGHQKYKIARHIPSEEGGYHLPIRFDDLKGQLPMPIQQPEIPYKPNDVADQNSVRERIETQRSKIISRLNSAEKLLSSLDGQLFAGDDQEFMLQLLQDLKRKVQISNKLTTRSSLFEDFIYQTGHYLTDLGKPKAARFFFKVAQGLPPTPSGGPGSPSDMLGDSTPTETTTGDPKAKEDTHAAFKEFFALLETGVADVPDEEEVKKSAEIVVEAQPVSAPREVPGAEPIEAELPAAEELEAEPVDVDQKIDSALADITVKDIVENLEQLSGLFKKREIARRLAIIDMMMDRLGIGSFFPSLGEATRSALESNQYVATRIEDVLSKLRGSLSPDDAEEILESSEQTTPANARLRRELEEKEEQDQARRERRRQREDEKAARPTPTAPGAGAAAPELAGPAGVEQARPVPIR